MSSIIFLESFLYQCGPKGRTNNIISSLIAKYMNGQDGLCGQYGKLYPTIQFQCGPYSESNAFLMKAATSVQTLSNARAWIAVIIAWFCNSKFILVTWIRILKCILKPFLFSILFPQIKFRFHLEFYTKLSSILWKRVCKLNTKETEKLSLSPIMCY